MTTNQAPSGATTLRPSGATSPRQPTILAAPYLPLTLGAVAIVSLVAFEALAVATAMPSVARDLDGLHLYGLAFAGTLATGVVGMVLAGAMADRHGPRRALWAGVGWFVAGLLIAGLATEMWLLVLGRVVQGLGGGMVSVALYVVVGRGYPEALRPRIFAAFSAAWVIPSLVGPTLAGLAVEHLHWRVVFLAVPLLAGPAAAVVAKGLASLPGPDPAEHAVLDPAGQRPARGRLATAVAASAGVLLLHTAGQFGGAMVVVGVIVGLVVVVVTGRRLLPVGATHAAAGLPSAVALRGVGAAAFVGAEVLLPLLLTSERGWSPSRAGMVLTLGALGWAAGSAVQSRVSDGSATRERWLLRSAFTLVAVGITSQVTLLVDGMPAAVAVVGWTMVGAGTGTAFPTLSVLTLRLAPIERHGEASAALQLSDALMSGTVLAAAGIMLALAPPQPRTYLAGFGLAAVIAILGAALSHRPMTPVAPVAPAEPTPAAPPITSEGSSAAAVVLPPAVRALPAARRAVERLLAVLALRLHR